MKPVIRIVSCFFMLLAWCGSVKEPVESPSPENVRAAMVAAFNAGGESALREYVRKHGPLVSRDIILNLAKDGLNDRSDSRMSASLLAIAVAAAKEKGDQGLEAAALKVEGEYYCLISDYDRAREFFNQSLVLYESRGDLNGQGFIYFRQGDIYFNTGDNSRAIAMFTKALPLFEQLNYPQGQGMVYRGLGDVYLYTGDTVKALEMFDKSLSFYERVDDPQGQGNSYFRRGLVYSYRGDNTQALAMLDKALFFFEKDNDLMGQGNVYSSRSEIYLNNGANAESLAMLGKALVFLEKVNDPRGQATVYTHYGEIYSQKGDQTQALLMYEKALSLFEKVDDPLGLGAVYERMAEIYLIAGDYAQTLAMYEKSLPFYEKTDEPIGQGNLYLHRGEIYVRTGDYTQAMAMYDKSLPFFEKAAEPRGQGAVYKNRGDVCMMTGDSARARVMYEKALPLFEKANDPEGQGNVAMGLGNYFSGTGNNSQAKAMYEKALSFYIRCEDFEDQAYSLYGQADIDAKEANTDLALRNYERSLDLLEQVRQRTGVEKLKLSFMEKVLDNYEGAANFMLGNGYGENAFRTAERMKARLFLDRLAEGLVDLEKGVNPELKAKRDDLERRLAATRKQLMEMDTTTMSSEESERRTSEIKASITQLKQELDEAKTRIRIGNPLYSSVQYPVAPTAAEVKSSVLHEGEALLEYFLTKQIAWCFVLTRRSFQAVKLPVSPDNLTRMVRSYLATVTQRRGIGETDDGDRGTSAVATADPEARRLYDSLVGPLGKSIRKKILIIVPDGILSRLPFELLETGRKRKPVRLIEQHAVHYAPSASVLAFYRTVYRREGTSDKFIGYGDPVYDFPNYQAGKSERGMTVSGETLAENRAKRGITATGLKLDRLPGTGEEVNTIGGLFQAVGRGEVAYLREEATEERARSEEMAGYGFIHLAAHGLLGDDYQAILLSLIPGAKEDGLLNLGEIMNLKWDARLVVLSACETGLGPVQRGEGVTGLARAVMYAGSPAAVVSLWSVSDEGTKELMTRFYRKILRNKLPPAQALQQAKREMASDPAWRSPFFWAAFVLYGE